MKNLGNENIDNANSLYFILDNVGGYIECNSTEENNENKYLIFASTDKNKKVLEKYTEPWDEIENQIECNSIETISGGKPIKYRRDFMKIRCKSNDDLPLGKILSIPVCIIGAGSVFKKDNNYCLQAHLHECLHKFVNEL